MPAASNTGMIDEFEENKFAFKRKKFRSVLTKVPRPLFGALVGLSSLSILAIITFMGGPGSRSIAHAILRHRKLLVELESIRIVTSARRLGTYVHGLWSEDADEHM
ncbi:unnamed protein product [Dovyalis caffra]|uniref:Transmembrane protein n=1 Tax=Dovyalis caffra TaxID=77055 RepID=A0AAV1SEN6_9ROSI|nr:unnamed protein product [Dovyalis caffra]